MTSETSELIQISEGVESIPERHYEDCDQNHTKRTRDGKSSMRGASATQATELLR